MSAQREFADLMTDTAVIASKATIDGYGRRMFGTPVTYRCRIQHQEHTVRNGSGRDITAAGKVFILGTPAVTVEDKMTLNGEQVTVLDVHDFHDERGPHHLTISFGRG